MRSLSRISVIALLLSVLSAGQAAAQSTNATAVAQRLQAQYRTIRTLQAQFTQTTGEQRLSGTLSVRGEAFRLDLGNQVLVTDGTTLWSYSRDDAQVIVQDYDPAQVGFSVGQIFTGYLDVFRVTGATRARIGGIRHDVLSLRPRASGSTVRDATLYVRSTDAIPTRVRVRDTNGGTLAFDLSNVRLNPSLPATTFRFTAPRGTEVVDLR
jgi:outer membrane lipoprotein-sorting protein